MNCQVPITPSPLHPIPTLCPENVRGCFKSEELGERIDTAPDFPIFLIDSGRWANKPAFHPISIITWDLRCRTYEKPEFVSDTFRGKVQIHGFIITLSHSQNHFGGSPQSTRKDTTWFQHISARFFPNLVLPRCFQTSRAIARLKVYHAHSLRPCVVNEVVMMWRGSAANPMSLQWLAVADPVRRNWPADTCVRRRVPHPFAEAVFLLVFEGRMYTHRPMRNHSS